MSHAAWLYFRFALSFRDVEDPLADRGTSRRGARCHRGIPFEGVEQARRNARAARRFFRKILKQGVVPNKLVTDKLCSYSVAHDEMTPVVLHDTSRWANDRAEVLHEAILRRDRFLRRFQSQWHAQLFVSTFGVVADLIRIRRQKVSSLQLRNPSRPGSRQLAPGEPGWMSERMGQCSGGACPQNG